MGLPLILKFSSILLITLINTFACKPRNPFVHTEISGPITIDHSEKEITFERAFKPKKQANEICFRYSENLKIGLIKDPPKFSDGTPLVIDLHLFDQKDIRYEFSSISTNKEGTICFVPDNYNEWQEISTKQTLFVKMIVRSNQKLEVSKIEWESYNSWDF